MTGPQVAVLAAELAGPYGLVLSVAGWLAAIAAGVAALAYIVRGGWRLFRGLSRLVDEWIGDPAQGRPGVLARLSAMESTQAEHIRQHHPPVPVRVTTEYHLPTNGVQPQ